MVGKLIWEISGELCIPVKLKIFEYRNHYDHIVIQHLYSNHFRHQNAVRISRTTLSLEWTKTSLSKASQRIRTPSRRKVAVCFPRLDLRSFSYIYQIRTHIRTFSAHLTELISKLKRVEGYNKEIMQLIPIFLSRPAAS